MGGRELVAPSTFCRFLGERTRAARESAGLSQAELARRAGVHRVTLGRIESGNGMPSAETVARIVRAIGPARSAPILAALAEGGSHGAS